MIQVPGEGRPRRLLVMRHAKISWKSGAADDHGRPLNERGRRDAPRVGARLAELDRRPELVISSDSERTRETWHLMAERFPDTEAVFTGELYLCDVADVVAELSKVPPEVTTVMVLGHNPGWEDVVDALSGCSVTLTTANVALLATWAGSWAEAARRTDWQLEQVLRPKEL